MWAQSTTYQDKMGPVDHWARLADHPGQTTTQWALSPQVSTWNFLIGYRRQFRQASACPRSRTPVAPSYKQQRGVGNEQHTAFHTLKLFFTLELKSSHPRCFRQSRSVGKQRERVRRSRGSAGLVDTLFRLYLDGCLSIIVSVRDFLCYSKIEYKCKFQFLPFTGLSVHLRVVNDCSLRLLKETDNLGQGQDQYGIAQTGVQARLYHLVVVYPTVVEVTCRL